MSVPPPPPFVVLNGVRYLLETSHRDFERATRAEAERDEALAALVSARSDLALLRGVLIDALRS